MPLSLTGVERWQDLAGRGPEAPPPLRVPGWESRGDTPSFGRLFEAPRLPEDWMQRFAPGVLPSPAPQRLLTDRIFEPEGFLGLYQDAGGDDGGVPGTPGPGVGPAPSGVTGPSGTSGVPGSSGVSFSSVMGGISKALSSVPGKLLTTALSLVAPPSVLGILGFQALNAITQKVAFQNFARTMFNNPPRSGTPSASPALSDEDFEAMMNELTETSEASPAEEGPATTGLGLGPPGVAEGAAAAASSSADPADSAEGQGDPGPGDPGDPGDPGADAW